MNILRAHPNDIETLNSISVAAKMYWGYPQEWLELWRDDLTISISDFKEKHIYKIVFQGEVAGFCVIIEGQEAYEIDHLWIAPKFIGKGLGRALLEASIAKVVPPNAKMTVVADPYAEAFYQKLGFETFSQIESLPKGRFLPVMQKNRCI